jgi:hypothetical protein
MFLLFSFLEGAIVEGKKCLICGNSNLEVKNAIVSDFLSERI